MHFANKVKNHILHDIKRNYHNLLVFAKAFPVAKQTEDGPSRCGSFTRV